MFLLDTNIVSASRKPSRNQDIVAWIDSQPRGSLRLAGPVAAELVRGARIVSDPVRRADLQHWVAEIASTHEITDMSADAFVLLGEMLATPSLARFTQPAPGARRAHWGADLQIAAIAITRDEPVATLNMRDFVLIHAEYPALKAFNPRTGAQLR